MEVTLPPPSSSSLEYQFPESPIKKGRTSLIDTSDGFFGLRRRANPFRNYRAIILPSNDKRITQRLQLTVTKQCLTDEAEQFFSTFSVSTLLCSSLSHPASSFLFFLLLLLDPHEQDTLCWWQEIRHRNPSLIG